MKFDFVGTKTTTEVQLILLLLFSDLLNLLKSKINS